MEIIFEHPLTEKLRTWLRLEYLLTELFADVEINTLANATQFFRHISDLLEILERGDLKLELYKDIEKQLAKFSIWAELPDVDQGIVQSWQKKLVGLSQQLKDSPRFNSHLQSDRLINAVRQRLSIPSGCCSFDLPTLHFWLNLSARERNMAIRNWLAPLEPLYASLSSIMSLIRHSSTIDQHTAFNGFFQDSAEQKVLLQVGIPADLNLYPQISGVKHRFMIRFLPFDQDNGTVPEQFKFSLGLC